MYSQSSSCVVPSGNIFDRLSEIPFWGYMAFAGVVLLISSIFGDGDYTSKSYQSHNYVRSYSPHRIDRNMTLPIRVTKIPKINDNISRIKVGDIGASKYVPSKYEPITGITGRKVIVNLPKIDTAKFSIATRLIINSRKLDIHGFSEPAQVPATGGDKDIEQKQPAVDTHADTPADTTTTC